MASAAATTTTNHNKILDHVNKLIVVYSRTTTTTTDEDDTNETKIIINNKKRKIIHRIININTLPELVYNNPNHNGLPTKIYTEKLLHLEYFDSYDQHKINAGYVDDKDYDIPYRYLKHWYIYDKRIGRHERKPLPFLLEYTKKNNSKYKMDQVEWPKDYILAGWVQPAASKNNNNEDYEQIYIELNNIDTFSVDGTPYYRGYWVCTKKYHNDDTTMSIIPNASYWLQEPCNVLESSQREISQEMLHTKARIGLTVLSLLLQRTPRIRANQSVDDMFKNHRRLLQINNCHNNNNNNYYQKGNNILYEQKVRFEKAILYEYVELMFPFLKHFISEFNEKCIFYTSLYKYNGIVDLDGLLRWTETAEEKILYQYTWGGPINNNNIDAITMIFPVSSDRKRTKRIMLLEEDNNNNNEIDKNDEEYCCNTINQDLLFSAVELLNK